MYQCRTKSLKDLNKYDKSSWEIGNNGEESVFRLGEDGNVFSVGITNKVAKNEPHVGCTWEIGE